MKSYIELTVLLLGLLFKASSTGNSTKVYYATLQIDSNAYDKFDNLLSQIQNVPVSDSVLKIIHITTVCDLQTGICSCTKNNSWTDEVCQNFSSCCNQPNCTFKTPNPTAMCLSDSRVIINGSLTVNISYSSEYYDKRNEAYGKHVTTFTEQLESCFSSLEWFDSVTITGFRQGSVIVDFVMNIMASIDVTTFEKIVNDAANSLNGTFNIVTKGFVKSNISEPKQPIHYLSPVTITCWPPEDLGTSTWLFKQNEYKVQITNGTEAKIFQQSISSKVCITNATEIWKGTFICEYNSKNSTSIIHAAIINLDVALIPEITIISSPPCPICSGAVSPVTVTVMCIISNSTENYNVSWTSSNLQTPAVGPKIQPGQIFYNTTVMVFCDENKDKLNAACAFTNRLSQTKSNSIDIPIIYDGSDVCKAEGDWPEVIANFTATMLCGGSTVGVKKRKCISQNNWMKEILLCVNTDLYNLLNDAENLKRGQGIVASNANDIFIRLRLSTENPTINTFANINVSVMVLKTMNHASSTQGSKWNTSVFPDFVKSSSNLLNESLKDYWQDNEGNYTLSIHYLQSFEGVIKQSNVNLSAMDVRQLQQENVHIGICANGSNLNGSCNTGLNTSILSTSNTVIQTGFKNLIYNLPSYTMFNETTIPNNIIMSVIPVSGKNTTISMLFQVQRPRNYQMFCVYFDMNSSSWSQDGCHWGGANNPGFCSCNHTSAFTILMSSKPTTLLFGNELTYTGLGFSIVSLTLCLIIECLVWNTVVTTNISHFRHTVLVNIMLCLLIAHCCFLFASLANTDRSRWCLVLTVMQHFCFLAMFFWTLCMSMGLLHQLIFVFVNLRKKVYLGLSFSLGYVCPLIIVTITIIGQNSGAINSYYNSETCWLIYIHPLGGSIQSFVIPAGIIVIVNMSAMVVVISRILKPTVSEGKTHDEKEVARSIVKTVVFLTPTLGITWIFGIFVQILDLTTEPLAQIVAYSFIIFNSFQGFFILLTGCLGEKRVRDALLKRFKQKQSAHYKSESSTRITSATKKK